MGKGGVGKTSIASAIAVGLSEKGHRVHLTTTDPAAHLAYTFEGSTLKENLTISSINPEIEVKNTSRKYYLQQERGWTKKGLRI